MHRNSRVNVFKPVLDREPDHRRVLPWLAKTNGVRDADIGVSFDGPVVENFHHFRLHRHSQSTHFLFRISESHVGSDGWSWIAKFAVLVL